MTGRRIPLTDRGVATACSYAGSIWAIGKCGNFTTALLGEIAPGGQAGRHMHPVPLLVYILEGAVSIEMDGHPTHVVSAGEAFTEVANTWHNGRNLGSTPARFLIVFADQDGTPITIRP